MSLINDALKRAQEDKDRGGPPPLPTFSPPGLSAFSDEPQTPIAASPKPASRAPLRVILLVAVLAAGAGWCAFHFRPRPHPVISGCFYNPIVPHVVQPTTQPTAQASVQGTVQAAALPTAQAAPLPTTQPAALPTSLKIAASQPMAAAITRPRVRVVAPPPGGLNLESPATQPAAAPLLASKAPANGPDDLPDLPPDLRIPLPGLSDTPRPATDPNPTAVPAPGTLPDRQGVNASPDNPPATAAKTAPVAQPAAKPARTIAAAADVAQQFHVSCIMFSDQGSTAIINGSPAKVGATIRAEGTAKAGLPEEAVVKRIDRNCVEVELGGERYLLRI